MPFRPISSEKLSSAVIRQIEDLILRGILRPGERLPAERELADRMEVSRPSLREALAHLQDTGLLVAKQGAGVFVADVLGSAFSPALADLIARHDSAVFDYLSFRRDMEGLAADRAARLASDTDLKVIDAIFQKMEVAHEAQDAKEEARLDAQFHMSIIEAGHNIVLLHMMRSMYDLLRDGVFYNRRIMFDQQTTRAALLDQHRAIRDALVARKPDAARQAINTHLDFVETAMRAHQRSTENEKIAQLRLEHEG